MNTSKKSRTRLVAAAVTAAVVVGGVGLWTHFHEAHGHNHAHDSHGGTALVLNNGKRWETDQALRTGMLRIRDAAALILTPTGAVSQTDTKKFAAAVQEGVAYLVQNCKLEPKADAALHVIITDLMSGAGLLAENPSSAEGTTLVTRALQQYPEYFEHPGWTPLAAGEPRG